MAKMLVETSSSESFDPSQYKDEYREKLLARIKAKGQGKTFKVEEKEEETGGEVIDIMEALRRSLDKGKRNGHSTRARHASKPAAAKRKSRPAAPASRKRRAS